MMDDRGELAITKNENNLEFSRGSFFFRKPAIMQTVPVLQNMSLSSWFMLPHHTHKAVVSGPSRQIELD